MTNTTTTPAAAVTAGAAWLDTHRPGWDRSVNPDAIEAWHPHNSVLGQVYGYDGAAPLTEQQRVDFGFVIPNERPTGSWAEADARLAAYEPLSVAWTELVESRRAAL
ncbi:hypothetical protein ACFYUR_12475 [Micromonospora haikouensis]|uniref:hypothetical protein n=1 Tax=Micromonospora haikouensis TaxID=686309 RepID=UPI00368C8A6B